MSSSFRVLGCLALWLVATAAWRPLLVPDEGRYASIAFHMLVGDPLVPMLNGLPFFHKPPLLYWIDMAAFSVLGVNPFAARMGPALGAFVLGASLYFHLRHWHGLRVAVAGVVIVATTPLVWVGGQYVNHDMGVAGCITAAVLAAVRALEVTGRQRYGWWVQAWMFCGLGVLAKGLIGVVLPGLIVLPWLMAQRRWSDLWWFLHPLGWLVLATVVGPWLWAMHMRFPEFIDYFIVEQHFRRYGGTTFNNQQPAWFFVAVLPLLTLPWSLWIVSATRTAWRRRLDRFQERWDAPAEPQAQPITSTPLLGLYLWWIVVIIGFFSVPRSKLVGYVLPAAAPWCALLACGLAHRARIWQRVGVVSALLCVAIVAGLAWHAPHSARSVALELKRLMQPGDRVLFVNEYFYDVPFYAQLQQPVWVLSDWDDPQIKLRDNWRKELHDARRFATAQQQAVLWPVAQAHALVCEGSSTSWVVAHSGWQRDGTAVPHGQQVFEAAGVRLWRILPSDCRGASR